MSRVARAVTAVLPPRPPVGTAASAAACRMSYSTQHANHEHGQARCRSLDQAVAAHETSSTEWSGVARSPDTPADPADLANNRGSDPQEVLSSSSWQAQQAMSSSYHRPDPSLAAGLRQQAPHLAGRLTEKVVSAAGAAAQAVTGAASALADSVKAASGAGHGARHPIGPDASPVSDEALQFGDQVPDTNPDTATSGQVDTATGTATSEMLQAKTEQGGYRDAAERLMDIEGLRPRETTGNNPRRS